MGLYKLTNKEGKSIEFDGDKFPDFIARFGNGEGCGVINELACPNCPISNNGAIKGTCSNFTGSTSTFKTFLDLTLEPVEKTYSLLELEDGEEYSCDEFPTHKYKNEDDALQEYCSNICEWQKVLHVFLTKTFRKIKKKKVKKTVELWCQKDLSKNIYFGLCVNKIRDVFEGCALVKLTGEYEVEV